jgi:hypothetical protein
MEVLKVPALTRIPPFAYISIGATVKDILDACTVNGHVYGGG